VNSAAAGAAMAAAAAPGSGARKWALDLSRGSDAARRRSEKGERAEDGALRMVPAAVLKKYRMKRDTGKGLRELWLTGQDIGVLSRQIGALCNLRTLGLANNRLAALPDTLFQLERLERLVLSGNQISALPDSVKNLASLQELRLDRNRLRAFPDAIFSLRRLRHLSATDNCLEVLPPGLKRLRLLSTLELDGNESLTDSTVEAVSWAELSKCLQVVGLARTGLTKAPPGLLALPELDLVRLPHKVLQLHALRELEK